MAVMSRAEFWLLTLVAELWYPVGLLAAEYLSEILNTEQVHGLSHAELAEAMDDLFQHRDIIAKRLGSEATFQPTRREIVTALREEHGPHALYYGLTAQGAARWEAQACPDWSRYLDESFGYDPNEGEAITSTQSLLADWLARQRDLGIETPLPGSETWDILKPWRATYWKTLPHGHRIRFRWAEQVEKYGQPDWHLGWDRRKTWWTQYLTDCYDGA